MIMLTSIFNEKAEHQKIIDFNYSIKGDIDKIGRIVTANFNYHKSEHHIQEKEKIRYRHLIEMLHLDHILKEFNEHLTKMDAMFQKIEDKNRLVREGFEHLQSDDLEGMRNLLSRNNIDTHLLNDDEVREATQDLMLDKINEQEDLQNALALDLDRFEQRVDGLDHNSKEYHYYKAELDIRRSELQKTAAKQNLNYGDAEKYLRVNDGNIFTILETEKSNQKEINSDTDAKFQQSPTQDQVELSELRDELPEHNSPNQAALALFSKLN